MNANEFPSLIAKTAEAQLVWLTRGYQEASMVLGRLAEITSVR